MTRNSNIQSHEKISGDRQSVRKPLAFTDRERTILLLVANGLSNQEIADQLTISPTTVKWYIKQIFNKLGVNRRTQAVRLALDHHLLEVPSIEEVTVPGIPKPLTPLIGRETELEEVIKLLNDPAVRLLTILGSGGMGKTRLALEAAQQQTETRRGQVCFVALESVTSLREMIQSIASAIGFQFHGSLDIGRQLLTSLRNRRLIIVLDNFEHLVDCAPFVNEMMISAPHLKILTTSRQRLNLSTETVFALHGLNYPSKVESNSHTYAAFELFLHVVRYIQPAYKPDSEDHYHICRICQIVEGMPLAIELAAKWMAMFSPAQIEAEIEKGINLLQTAWQDLPERHRNMRAVFEHSWRLLSPEEQTVFKRLSVFRGGFDRTAAEQVTGATLFTLSTLVDKSLIMSAGKDRFQFHELIRQFAKEKLQVDQDEYLSILRHHCKYFASVVESYEKKIKTDVSAMAKSILAVRYDHVNILAGWHYALKSPVLTEIGKYVFTISAWYQTGGLNSEATQTFAHALRLFEGSNLPEDVPTRVRLKTHYGWFLQSSDQLEFACQVLSDAVADTPVLDHSHSADAGLLLGFLASALALSHQLDGARKYAQQGLTICQSCGFQFGIWVCFAVLGGVEHIDGRNELAYYYHHEALIHAEKHGHLLGQIQSLMHLGCTACALGDVADALAHFRRGLILMQTFLNVDVVFLTILGIAGIHVQRGRAEVALELLAILLCHPQYGSPVLTPTADMLLGQLRSRLSSEHVDAVIEKASRGELNSHRLEQHFGVSPELINQLSELLEAAAV